MLNNLHYQREVILWGVPKDTNKFARQCPQLFVTCPLAGWLGSFDERMDFLFSKRSARSLFLATTRREYRGFSWVILSSPGYSLVLLGPLGNSLATRPWV